MNSQIQKSGSLDLGNVGAIQLSMCLIYLFGNTALRQAETCAEMCCWTTLLKNHSNIVCDNVALALDNVTASRDGNWGGLRYIVMNVERIRLSLGHEG
jgi:hypothetical protein